MMWTRAFWAAVAERAIKTFAQALAAAITTALVSVYVTNLDWSSILLNAAIATLLSVLTSIASNAATKTGPSLTAEKVVPLETPPT